MNPRRWIAVAAFLAGTAFAQSPAPPLAKATLAGGCFWCVEADFDNVDGVVSATSGYIGGRLPNPTYERVSAGTTGDTEAVVIVFDPRKVSYEKLLDAFWRSIDPTVVNRQFCDVGSQYRTGVFVHDEAQRRAAEASKEALEKSKPFKEPIVTPIETATAFYPAEAYHQDYHLKNPIRYRHYRSGCGRDARLQELWGSRRASSSAAQRGKVKRPPWQRFPVCRAIGREHEVVEPDVSSAERFNCNQCSSECA